MDSANSQNIETLFNICANLTEIVGIRYGIVFIITAVLIAFLKQWKVARNYLLLGIATTFCALAAPGFLNWLVACVRDAHADYLLLPLTILIAIFTLAIIIIALALLYLPLYIAKKHQKLKRGWIIGLSIFSILIPFLWSIAVFLAYKPDKPRTDNGQTNSVVV